MRYGIYGPKTTRDADGKIHREIRAPENPDEKDEEFKDIQLSILVEIARPGQRRISLEGLGMDIEIHSCGPVMRHLMAACRNANFYEVNLVHPDCANAWSLPFYASNYSDQLECIGSDGCVEVPMGPGFGVAYDWDAIQRAAIETTVIR